MKPARQWSDISPIEFVCEKAPAAGRGGVVVTNHPLGTAAGVEMLANGGNAVDAVVAALFALTVVEPMMVGVAGGGFSHLRFADGRHVVIDAMASGPARAHPTIFEPVSDEPPHRMETVGRRNAVGRTSVAVPGNLLGWASMHERFGRLPFADLLDPAIRLAERGFAITHYLAGAIRECADDLRSDTPMAATFLPDGEPLPPGARLAQPRYAEALRLIARDGAAALHGGPLGAALAASVGEGADPGWLSEADLSAYGTVERRPIVGRYRGHEIAGPPPPASSGVHIVQMLNIVEDFDVAAMGFGTARSLDLLARVIAIAHADRLRSSGDPDFVDVPVERLTSKAYADECRRTIALADAPSAPRDAPGEPACTTHVTIADRDGNVVTATHTINGIFGARFMEPETGIIPNNYMMNFDPHPGRALSVAPGKRVPTSMAPMIVLRDGAPRYALGLPGGVRIYPSAFQAILDLVDHGMSLQEAVEAPRLWTDGYEVEIERGFASQEGALAASGHRVKVVPHIGGGMNAVEFEEGGRTTGAACWRADGTVAAMGGGLARPGVRFWPDRLPPEAADEPAPGPSGS